jgi:hypothetical protein
MLDMKSFGHFRYQPPVRSAYNSTVRLNQKLIIANSRVNVSTIAGMSFSAAMEAGVTNRLWSLKIWSESWTNGKRRVAHMPEQCEECSRLLNERTKLYIQWLESRGELAQTPKSSPNYHQRVAEEKAATGRWLHVGNLIDAHAKDHAR